MTVLYNAHTDGDEYRITKYDDLGNPESSYLVSLTECQCPAGVRPSCRHRDMLPLFLARNAVDTFWFLDWDRKGWVTNEPANLRTALIEDLPANHSARDGDVVGRMTGTKDMLAPQALHRESVAPEGLTVDADDTDDYGEDPIGLESLPPVRPAWRRI